MVIHPTLADIRAENGQFRGRAEAKMVKDVTDWPLCVGDIARFKKRRPRGNSKIELARVLWIEDENAVTFVEMVELCRATKELIENGLTRQIKEVHDKVIEIERAVALVDEKIDRYQAGNDAILAEIVRILLASKRGEVSSSFSFFCYFHFLFSSFFVFFLSVYKVL